MCSVAFNLNYRWLSCIIDLHFIVKDFMHSRDNLVGQLVYELYLVTNAVSYNNIRIYVF